MKVKEALKKGLRRSPSMALTVARAYSLILGVRANMALFLRFPYVYIASDVLLIGVFRIRIGSNVAIGSGSWLNVNDRNSPSDGLVIGDNCFIGKRNFFSVGRSIVLRDYCLTALNCAFIGSSHRYDDPMSAYMTTGVTLGRGYLCGSQLLLWVRLTSDWQCSHRARLCDWRRRLDSNVIFLPSHWP